MNFQHLAPNCHFVDFYFWKNYTYYLMSAHTNIPAAAESGSPYADDIRLVQACLRNDDAAWSALSAGCKGLCLSIAQRYSVTHDFDDLFSAFIVKLLGTRDGSAGVLQRYDGSAALKTYLYFIFKNLVLNHIRDRRKLSLVDDIETTAHTVSTVEYDRDPVSDTVSEAETAEVLRAAIATLPAREKNILELYYFQDLTVRQIGAMLQCNGSTISRVLKQCYAKLKVYLAEHLETDEVPL